MPITAGSDRGQGRGAGGGGFARLRWRFTAAAVLLLLDDGPSHGYRLLTRLRPMLPSNSMQPDPGGFYRLLRGLEDDGSVRSRWGVNPEGPARRVYELTDSGRDTLDGWASAIESEAQAIGGFLAAYYRVLTEHGLPESTG